MESASQKIISKIEELLVLMKLSDDGLCVYYYGFFEYILTQLRKPHNPEKIAENILQAYGGMGTFGDTGIWKDGKPLIEEDDKFQDLSTELFLLCEEAVR